MLLAICFQLNAQQGFYVPVAGKLYFSADTATIFSNVINEGQIGLGKAAVINFTGRRWQNESGALITDESSNGLSGTGGWIRFFADQYRQQIAGGYNAATTSGTSFTRIQIQNRWGVELEDGSMKVRQAISFKEGLFYLNGQSLVLGNGKPGTVDGYGPDRFFVTGAKGEGLLIRENAQRSDGQIVFPIGTSEGAYTPAAIRSLSATGDDYYASVSDSVWSARNSGHNLHADGVNKTWELGKRWRPGEDEVEVWLQHNWLDEGIGYFQNRSNSYISMYTGQHWDTSQAQRPQVGQLGGILPVSTSSIHTRMLSRQMANGSYFTKFAARYPVNEHTQLYFNATRIDKDQVYVFWRTNPEVNVRYFVVERRLASETQFSSRDTVLSRAVNGYSQFELFYNMTDPNSFGGISFYRLKMVGYNGEISYSVIVPVGPIRGLYNIYLWPNPTTDQFYVGLSVDVPARSIAVWNVIGQKIMQEEVNGRTVIPMRGLQPGSYLVGVISTANRVIETKKLLVLGK
ncbi:MAG: T9SS type A sorting domain-containing protein [Chitinophagaceae bacterium]